MTDFERMLENSLQSRNLFTGMNENQRREFLERVLREVKNDDKFGRLLFDIDMINDRKARESLHYQLAVGIARYYYGIENLEPDERSLNLFLGVIERMIKKKLDEQEKADSDDDDEEMVGR